MGRPTRATPGTEGGRTPLASRNSRPSVGKGAILEMGAPKLLWIQKERDRDAKPWLRNLTYLRRSSQYPRPIYGFGQEPQNRQRFPFEPVAATACGSRTNSCGSRQPDAVRE